MKKVLIYILSILCAVCIGLDIWCACTYRFAKVKHINNTINLGLQETTGGDKKAFMELTYFSNANKNGLEMMEIKYNYFADQNKNAFTSVGQQFVANTSEDKISIETDKNYSSYKTVKEKYEFPKWCQYHNVFFSHSPGQSTSLFEYQVNDNEFVFGSDVGRDIDKEYFLVELDNSFYRLKFKQNTPDEQFHFGTYNLEGPVTKDINFQYCNIDEMLLAKKILDSFQKAEFKNDGLYESMRFADYFTYEKHIGNNVYVNIADEDLSKIKYDFTNNYVVKVTKSEDGARQSSDSMFKQIKGESRFNYTGAIVYDDYSFGKVVKTLTINDFNYGILEGKNIVLKLKEEALENCLKEKYTSLFNVKIDLRELKKQDLNFIGFADDSGLKELSIKKATIIDTVDGVTVEREVAYA